MGSGASYQVSFPIFSVLGVLFIALKLIGVIGWSWWWVLAPFWVPVGILFVLLVVIGVAAYISK